MGRPLKHLHANRLPVVQNILEAVEPIDLLRVEHLLSRLKDTKPEVIRAIWRAGSALHHSPW